VSSDACARSDFTYEINGWDVFEEKLSLYISSLKGRELHITLGPSKFMHQVVLKSITNGHMCIGFGQTAKLKHLSLLYQFWAVLALRYISRI
jgi:hypothetical protein